MSQTYSRIVSAIEVTLDQLRAGPRGRADKEPYSQFLQRANLWQRDKRRFCQFAITCLKSYDLELAKKYYFELVKVRVWDA